MEKLTFAQLREKINSHNRSFNVKQQYSDKYPLTCVIVFKSENWPDKDYSLESRSYEFRSDEKYFLPTMLGTSIFAHSLDDKDHCRLDWYLDEWKIDYCYIKE